MASQRQLCMALLTIEGFQQSLSQRATCMLSPNKDKNGCASPLSDGNYLRKARWVLDGHNKLSPIGLKYLGVVSRESVRIVFTYAALIRIDVCAADIRNVYLQALSSQTEYIICGPEFGIQNVGRTALIH